MAKKKVVKKNVAKKGIMDEIPFNNDNRHEYLLCTKCGNNKTFTREIYEKVSMSAVETYHSDMEDVDRTDWEEYDCDLEDYDQWVCTVCNYDEVETFEDLKEMIIAYKEHVRKDGTWSDEILPKEEQDEKYEKYEKLLMIHKL